MSKDADIELPQSEPSTTLQVEANPPAYQPEAVTGSYDSDELPEGFCCGCLSMIMYDILGCLCCSDNI